MPQPTETQAAEIFRLEHPHYTANLPQWKKNRAAYDGGRPYIALALIKHLAEFKEEYEERKLRAYYFNFPRRVVRLLTQYVLSVRPTRENADPDISEDFDRAGHRVDEVMRQFSINLRIYGVAWLQIDMPSFDGPVSKAREQSERLRPYCFAPSPENIKAWAYGDDCRLLWVCTEESFWHQPDPFRKGENITVRKLWTRTDCTTVRVPEGGRAEVSGYFEHNLGCVPFIRKTEADGYAIGSSHWFADIVGISDAILNNESESQMNVVKQMFSLLVLPETFVSGARQRIQEMAADIQTSEKQEEYIREKLDLIIARGVAITESAEARGTARYITPPGIEIEQIDAKNARLIKQLYSLCFLSTDKDTKLVESAEAKQWDFQAIEQQLVTHADILEQSEYEAWEIMAKWSPSLKLPKLNYNRIFAVFELTESISALLELYGMNQQSETYQRECGKAAVALLNRIRQMPQETVETILKEIDAAENPHQHESDDPALPEY